MLLLYLLFTLILSSVPILVARRTRVATTVAVAAIFVLFLCVHQATAVFTHRLSPFTPATFASASRESLLQLGYLPIISEPNSKPYLRKFAIPGTDRFCLLKAILFPLSGSVLSSFYHLVPTSDGRKIPTDYELVLCAELFGVNGTYSNFLQRRQPFIPPVSGYYTTIILSLLSFLVLRLSRREFLRTIAIRGLYSLCSLFIAFLLLTAMFARLTPMGLG